MTQGLSHCGSYRIGGEKRIPLIYAPIYIGSDQRGSDPLYTNIELGVIRTQD